MFENFQFPWRSGVFGRSAMQIPTSNSGTLPTHAPSSVAPNASSVIGGAGTATQVIGRRVGNLNPLGTVATPTPKAAAAAPSAEDRMDKMESMLASIAAKVGVAMDDEEDPDAESDEDDPAAETEEDEAEAAVGEEKPSARGKAAGPASIAQIEAACPGASSDFVLACARAEMSVKQAKAFYAGQQSKIPGRRGRKPLGSGRSGAAAATQPTGASAMQAQLDARTDEIMREQAGKIARIDALGIAMNEIKAADPDAFRAFRKGEMARMRRESIGAAPASN